jgi:hypothetical protein
LLDEVLQLKGIRRNTDKGGCPLCLGEEHVICIKLDCLETRNWRTKFLSEKWLIVNKEVAYRKILRCCDKDQVRSLGTYIDKVKHKWFNKQN